MDRIFHGELRPIMVSLSVVRVIMTIARILVVEWLCQTVMERIAVLEYLLSGARGTCGYVLSYLTLNDTVYRGLGSSGVYPVLKIPLGMAVGA
jgi:hypothetical protein